MGTTTMPDRSETIGVRLTPAERDKFERYVEESNEFDSLSRFFRTIAHRYIAVEDEEPSLDPEEVIDAVDTAVTPLEDRLERIEDHVLSIDSNVRDDDKIDRLARDIYSSLPTHRDETELPDLDEVSQYGNASDLALVQAISTPYMWAEYYDEDLQDVRRACARMLEYYPDVKFVEDETDSQTSSIPDHDDLSVDTTPSHTDQSFGQNEQSVSHSTTVGDSGPSTVRRYYKTGGD